MLARKTLTSALKVLGYKCISYKAKEHKQLRGKLTQSITVMKMIKASLNIVMMRVHLMVLKKKY